jgi:starch synthase (maltosyl-transferring)
MDVTPEPVRPRTGRADDGTEALRVLYFAGGKRAIAEVFADAAAQGFSHVMLPPPWRDHGACDRFLVRDFTALAAGFGGGTLAGLVRLARQEGIGLLLDVVLDRIQAGSPLLARGEGPFEAFEADLALDPRRNAGGDAAPARLAGAGDVLALAAWWAPVLSAWQAAGAEGFRLLGLPAIPEAHLAAFVGALRQHLPNALLLPWTPGLPRSALARLRGTGMDAVFAPVPWWDWQSGWLWDELAALIAVAPVLGLSGRPPGPSHQQMQGGDARSVSLAPFLGQGWMHVGPEAEAAAMTARVCAANGVLAREPAFSALSLPGLPAGGAGRVLSLLRCDTADHRGAGRVALVLINADPIRSSAVQGTRVLPATGGGFGRFTAIAGQEDAGLAPDTQLSLAPGEVRIYAASSRDRAMPAARTDSGSAREAAAAPRLAIDAVTPSVDAGAFPVKAIAGEIVSVEADIVFDGHYRIAAALRWQAPGQSDWQEVPMTPLPNDRWQAAFPLEVLGLHRFAVVAWQDRFGTFRDEIAKKSAAGVAITLELAEGEALVKAACARAKGPLAAALKSCLARLADGGEAERLQALLSPDLAASMAAADDRPQLAETRPMPVDAERIEARFASWYEVFPRSLSDDPSRHGTFADVERHLPRIRDMGFDVLYFPPISPIGRTNRKGRNNSLTPAPDDPGSPYAIGSEAGGHDALHPQLGTLEDFASLRRAAAAHGLELAIDFAIQCSPDHPWLKQHRGWFDWRPDGSIRYAENPPKKYEDIVNVDFYAKDAVPDLWVALCDVVLFWAEQGVRLFRVDNPHTKPFPFWQWMIGEVRRRYPDAIFLAEAFTRPKVMYRLAKIGFSQSYTYFTWRNAKRELQDYLVELNGAPRDFFRPHFFVNTPDINPAFLQASGRPGFLIRAALAATLSGLWGVYNGFELCEAAAVPGREEYLDSEKYQLRAWDWDRPGNIIAEIAALNQIRRQNPALQTHLGVTFHNAFNDAILYFQKATADRSNIVLVAVSLDPGQAQEADFEVPLWTWALPDSASVMVEDLLTGDCFAWNGKMQHVRLTPERPYAIWRVRTSF